MGATPKPQVNRVMPTCAAGSEMFQSSMYCWLPTAYEPAVYAVNVVAMTDSQVMARFRLSGQRKGSVYFFKSGHSGGGDDESGSDRDRWAGEGSSVSNVKYCQLISSSGPQFEVFIKSLGSSNGLLSAPSFHTPDSDRILASRLVVSTLAMIAIQGAHDLRRAEKRC